MRKATMVTALDAIRIFGLLVAPAVPLPVLAQQAPNREAPMQVEAKIPLGDVRGRIDHLAVDLTRRRLFIAELGNDSLGIVDLDARTVARRLPGLREPQGVAYVPGADIILVANARDGTVERYRGADLMPLGRTILRADADNLRPDPAGGGLVWVGYGGTGHGAAGAEGGLTALDAVTGQPVGATIPLPAHPESFQLETAGPRVFANLPGVGGAIAVLDRAARRQVATWSVPGRARNFPMALDERNGRLFVGFREPPTLAILDVNNGAVLGLLPLCGDADDLFLDARRRLVYAVCGEGAVDIFEDPPGGGRVPRHLARVTTSPGARTGLFVPDLDRLFVAARAEAGKPAAIWVLRQGLPP